MALHRQGRYVATIAALVVLHTELLQAALDPSFSITQFDHRVWTAESGLSQNTVTSIAQTPDGCLWFGTEIGLLRFDGVHFNTFDSHNIPALKSEVIVALLVDRAGTLWVGTRGGGLLSYADGHFKIWTKKDGLGSDSVQALYEDPSGYIWIGTDGGGVTRLKAGRLSRLTHNDGLGDDTVFSITGNVDGDVWLGTHNGLTHWKDGRLSTLTTNNGLPSNDVRSVLADINRSVWVGTASRGLAYVSSTHVARYTVQNGLSDDHVWSLYKDSSGSLWIGTGGHGLARFAQGRFSQYTEKEGFSGKDVWAIMEDREGSLWIGTAGGGLNRLRGTAFRTLGKREGLSSDMVLGLSQDRTGTVWIGTADSGVDQWADGQIKNSLIQAIPPGSQVFSITEDRDGGHWFATRGGLGRFYGGRFKLYGRSDGLPDEWVSCSLTDSRGVVWVGTRAGLSYFNGSRFVTYGLNEGLSDKHVLSLGEDPVDHSLWVGTAGGLSHLKDGRFRSYTTNDGLSNDVILAIHAEPDGTIWIGTDGGGLNWLRKNHISKLTMRDGMLDDTIFQVLPDGRGNLWMSSNRGIFEAPERNLLNFAEHKTDHISFHTFGTNDGMRSHECNGGFQSAGLRLHDGRLAFPTTKGLVIVDPARIVNSHPYLQPVLEQVSVDDRLIPNSHLLSVPPGQGRLEFQYTAPSFIDPGKIRFKYKLEGFDTEWRNAGSRRVAYYTNIPPGHYRFRVIAFDTDGVEGKTEASVALYLRPHLYQTWPFKVILYFSCVGCFCLWFRLRIGRAQAQQRKLENLVDERTEDLRRSERKFREIAENIREVFWIVDPTTNQFLYVSPAFKELWGFSPDEVLKDQNLWLRSVHPDDQDLVAQSRLQRQSAPSESTCQYRVVKAEATHWVIDRAFPVFDKSGQMSRIVGVVEDVTEQKTAQELLRKSNEQLESRVQERTSQLILLNRALETENAERRLTEEQLRAAKEMAERANLAKSYFLANMSHELRTPMNGIIAMTELALADSVGAEQKEYLEIVDFSAKSLLRIINDVLDLSKAEAGKITLEAIPFEFVACLKQAIAAIAVKAKEKGLRIENHVASAVPEVLIGDSSRLRQILLNLLGNAVKFTQAGTVSLRVGVIENRDSWIRLIISVTDTGMGIAKENQQLIFNAFSQVDETSTRQFGGTGLGLTICSQLVKLMNGDLWVESTPGVGSTFHFTADFGVPECTGQSAPVGTDEALVRT